MWVRDNFEKVPGAECTLMYFCFFDGEPKLELDPSRDGPISSPPELTVVAYHHPRSSLTELLGFDIMDNTYELLLPPEQRERLFRADSVVMVGAAMDDPSGLQVLWQASAYIRAAAYCGAFLCLDLPARRWWQPPELMALSPDRPFLIGEHIELETVFEDAPPFARTTGMQKFARPDLVIRNLDNQPGKVLGARRLLSEVAQCMGEGRVYTEKSLFHLQFPGGTVEAGFVRATHAEDDFFRTRGALILVDPVPDRKARDRAREGCPQALALMAQFRDQEPQVDSRKPGPPQMGKVEEPKSPGPVFSGIVERAVGQVAQIALDSPQILETVLGRPWSSSDEAADRTARERFLRLVGLPEAKQNELWSTLHTVVGTGAVRVAVDALGLDLDLASQPAELCALYDSHLKFAHTQEFGPCFGVEKLEETLPSNVSFGFWLFYGYHGCLPLEPKSVEECVSLGVFLSEALLKQKAASRSTTLELVTVLFSRLWDSIYQACAKELQARGGFPKVSAIKKLMVHQTPELTASATQGAFAAMVEELERHSDQFHEIPAVGEVVALPYGRQTVELSLFRALVGCVGAYVVCQTGGLSFPAEQTHPRLLTVYRAVEAFVQSEAHSQPPDSECDPHAWHAAAALEAYCWEGTGGQSALLPQMAKALSKAAKRVLGMLALS